MNDNPLVKEIRKHRAAILASHEGDYLAMMNAMKKKQWESGHEVVSLRSKSIESKRNKTKSVAGR